MFYHSFDTDSWQEHSLGNSSYVFQNICSYHNCTLAHIIYVKDNTKMGNKIHPEYCKSGTKKINAIQHKMLEGHVYSLNKNDFQLFLSAKKYKKYCAC